MRKRRVILLIVCIPVILLNLLLFSITSPLLGSITAKVPMTGSISLVILEILKINITSPENLTYEFNLSERMNLDNTKPPYYFPLDINTTSNREIEEWFYTVKDEKDYPYFEDSPFEPNQTYGFLTGSNFLEVIGFSGGSSAEDGVYFYVNLTNAVPMILLNETEFYYCEDSGFSKEIEVIDPNEDLNNLYISPANPFYTKYSRKQDSTYLYEVYIKGFNRSQFDFSENSYSKNFYNLTAIDEAGLSDIQEINITSILINKKPEITNPPSIPDDVEPYPVYIKLYLKGEHTLYNETWAISDLEDGPLSEGNLTINLTYANGSEFSLFSIDNLTGRMSYEATEDSPLNEPMLLNLSVTDNPLLNPHENISVYCETDGSSNTLIRQIYFLVTEDNRRPEITSFYPLNESLNVEGEEELYFNISFWDDDHDILSTRWFVGGKLIDGSGNLSHNSSDEFEYTFGCGIGGSYNITVSLSDGVLGEETNHTWAANVQKVDCPERPPSGGGGMGGPSDICYEDWVCEDWSTCQSLKGSYQHELIDSGDYQKYIEQCKQLGYDQEHWGFQMRVCHDLNNCNNFQYRYPMPLASQVCFYTEHPSCTDGIKNCHSGGCELGIDCGGPCPACPTCSDGLKNQGEEGIDCGGPCPYPCEKTVADFKPDILLILVILLVLVLLFVIYRFIVILRKKKEKKEGLRQQKIQQLFHQE